MPELQLRAEILEILKENCWKWTSYFLNEVFGIDTEKTFTEEEMVSKFGMLSTEARSEWFAEHF